MNKNNALEETNLYWNNMFVLGCNTFKCPLENWHITNYWEGQDLRPKELYCIFNFKGNVRKYTFFTELAINGLSKEELDVFLLDIINGLEQI